MSNGTKDIFISSIDTELYDKIKRKASLEGKGLAPFCREKLAQSIETPTTNTNEHPTLTQIVTLLKIGGAFALLLFIIFLIFSGIIAVNYLKQTGGI